MITKHSLQVTFDKLMVEYDSIINTLQFIKHGSLQYDRFIQRQLILKGKLEMLQDLVKEADN